MLSNGEGAPCLVAHYILSVDGGYYVVGVLGALLFIHVFTQMCLVFSHAVLLICTIRFYNCTTLSGLYAIILCYSWYCMVFVGLSMPLGIVQYCGFLGKVEE